MITLPEEIHIAYDNKQTGNGTYFIRGKEISGFDKVEVTDRLIKFYNADGAGRFYLISVLILDEYRIRFGELVSGGYTLYPKTPDHGHDFYIKGEDDNYILDPAFEN